MKATLAVRQAVRPWLDTEKILMAVSGGADSLALALGTVKENIIQSHPAELFAIIINHNLQAGSKEVALKSKSILNQLGIENVEIVDITVNITDGMEASARRARYDAIDEYANKIGAGRIFLGHTKDDLAENVLLGLARGSGTRSLSGMAVVVGNYVRPLLDISRETTELACKENEIDFWIDPHNNDEKYLRARVRHSILPLMEEKLGPGIVEALARSSRILREDADALDEIAVDVMNKTDTLEVDNLRALPRAVRARVLRRMIYEAGAPSGSISADHLAPVEALITEWHGQGEISLPGGVKVSRISGRISLLRKPI